MIINFKNDLNSIMLLSLYVNFYIMEFHNRRCYLKLINIVKKNLIAKTI